MQLPSSEPATPMALDRVLIIDDNEIERYALRQFLSTSRYEVIEATGGYDGLRLARQAHPDVIFLDLMMPDVHGLEVLKMLKAIEDTRHIPVVLFTSQRLEDESDQERAAAADALLMKSELSRDTVIETMHRVCGSDGERPCQKRLRRSSTSTTTRRLVTRPRASCIAPASRCWRRRTGSEALQITREDLPPLVILDINLPDINGVEVCRRIKTDPATASTMVLQMSATNIAVIDRVNSLAAGADSFLVEPVEPEELEAVSRALLRLHRSEAALRRALAERELLLQGSESSRQEQPAARAQHAQSARTPVQGAGDA